MAWAHASVNASIIVLGSRGGYDATPESVWEVTSHLFYKPLFFYIPQTLRFLRGRVLPCKIINPRLFSHVYI